MNTKKLAPVKKPAKLSKVLDEYLDDFSEVVLPVDVEFEVNTIKKGDFWDERKARISDFESRLIPYCKTCGYRLNLVGFCAIGLDDCNRNNSKL